MSLHICSYDAFSNTQVVMRWKFSFSECPPGYGGFDCKFPCYPPFYGAGCLQKCHCPMDLCDVVSGCTLSSTIGKMFDYKSRFEFK